VQVHTIEPVVVGDEEAVVDLAFAALALAALRLAHQFREPMLERARTDARPHALAAVLFQQRVVDPLQAKQLRQQQP